jgi:hypothetical protein
MSTKTCDTSSEYRIFVNRSLREIQKQLTKTMLKRFSSKFERFSAIPDDSSRSIMLRVMMPFVVAQGYRISSVILKVGLKSTFFVLYRQLQ